MAEKVVIKQRGTTVLTCPACGVGGQHAVEETRRRRTALQALRRTDREIAQFTVCLGCGHRRCSYPRQAGPR